MNKHQIFNAFGLLISSLLISLTVFAQSDLRKTEVGVALTTVYLFKPVGEGPIGVGGRFTYNVNDYLAIDSEFSYFPQDPSSNFGETEFLSGIRAGIRSEKAGIFAKVRPGLMRFGGDGFKVYNGKARNNFALDVGGVLEYYPNKRVILRLDIGDTIIPFGNDSIRRAGKAFPITPGTTHNVQGSIGIGFRF